MGEKIKQEVGNGKRPEERGGRGWTGQENKLSDTHRRTEKVPHNFFLEPAKIWWHLFRCASPGHKLHRLLADLCTARGKQERKIGTRKSGSENRSGKLTHSALPNIFLPLLAYLQPFRAATRKLADYFMHSDWFIFQALVAFRPRPPIVSHGQRAWQADTE